MKIPATAVISSAKLRDYLLQIRRKNDKARFLAQGGFHLHNSDKLDGALRSLIAEHDADIERVDEYGTFYRVEGKLRGPDAILTVVTIWMAVEANSEFRFVTLKPAK